MIIPTDILHRISVGIVWVPFILLTFKITKAGKEYHLFWYFLLASGFIDLIGFMLPEGDEGDQIYYPIHLVYLLVEGVLVCVFSLHFINLKNEFKSRLRSVVIGYILLCFLIIPLVLLESDWERFINWSSIFSGSLLVIFSFLSAFGLLGLAETTFDLLHNPWFWILAGIFVYSFGSFFIDLLIPSQMAYYVYSLRHVMNVLRGCFFLIGVLKINSKSEF